jgi:hypothetical protein
MRYSKQCLDLEKRVKVFLDNLEFYSRLADQPLNCSKTEALYSARAIGLPSFDIKFDCSGGETISWKKDFKYLGYIVSCKLGWGKLIKDVQCRVRRQIALIRSFRLFGCSSRVFVKLYSILMFFRFLLGSIRYIHYLLVNSKIIYRISIMLHFVVLFNYSFYIYSL